MEFQKHDIDGVEFNNRDYEFRFFERVGRRKIQTGVLKFGYLDASNAWENYQGAEYNYMGFDELTQLKQDNYIYMFSRLRSTAVGIPKRIRACTNPPKTSDGEWVYRRFIDPKYAITDENGEEGWQVKKDKGERIFLASSIYDNPYLANDDDYLQNLQNLDPVTRAQLLEGNWEIHYEGTLFDQSNERWISRDKLPPHRKKVRYWDLAATSEEEAKRKSKEADFTCGLLMSEYHGNYYVEDIVYGRFSPETTNNLQIQCAKRDGRSCMIRDEEQPGAAGKFLTEMKKKTELGKFNYDSAKITGNKLTRAEPVAAEFEKGRVYFVEGCENIKKLQDEMYTFGLSTHDDTVDALSGAYNVLQQFKGKSRVGVAKPTGQFTKSGIFIGNSGNRWSQNNF